MMNKVKVGSNMYQFLNQNQKGYTWNTLLGRCPHNCSYCFNQGKPFFEGVLRLNEKNLKDKLGSGNFIFVGSSNDLFAEKVPSKWITKTLEHCRKFNNTYLFQTKNPERFLEFIDLFPEKTIFGTTLETNREVGLKYSKAPPIISRMSVMRKIKGRKMITIEPVFDFDLEEFIEDLQMIKPEWINIGADSKGHNLPEPSKEKIKEFIDSCRCFTEVKIKENLSRIIGSEEK